MLRKISLSLTLLVILLVVLGGIVFSADLYSEIPTEGKMSADPNYGTGTFWLQKSQNTAVNEPNYGEIFLAFCGIYNVGNGEVELFGQTIATKVSEEVGYTLYLQQWNGSSWINISDVDNIDYNVISIEDYHYKSREGGYYYRAKAVHFVDDQGVNTETTHYSEYILIE